MAGFLAAVAMEGWGGWWIFCCKKTNHGTLAENSAI